VRIRVEQGLRALRQSAFVCRGKESGITQRRHQSLSVSLHLGNTRRGVGNDEALTALAFLRTRASARAQELVSQDASPALAQKVISPQPERCNYPLQTQEITMTTEQYE
jgi:hypothetical protein